MVPPPVETMPDLKTILLVEDDVSLRASVGEFLKDNGYRPLAAGTIREAWETIVAVQPPVCILDLNLPDGSGIDLLKRIADAKLPVQVIVMTAFPLSHLKPDDTAGTLIEWLTKPLAPVALLGAIEKALFRSASSR
jgi:DNA-binding NtrC family response regulator